MLTTSAARIRASLAEPIEIDGTKIFVDVATGATVSGVHHDDGPGTQSAESGRRLIAKADFEMYRAKARARGQRPPAIRARTISDSKQTYAVLPAAANCACSSSPKSTWQPNAIVAAEALVRWQHPELGLLAPGEFIPLAEDSNLIAEVGAHVLAEACRVGAAWRVSRT